MSTPRSLEFIQNIDPHGCFEANTEGLTRIGQGRVRSALDKDGLYIPDGGLQIVGAEILNASMRGSMLPITYKEELPYYDVVFGGGDEVALDNSPDMAKRRLEILQRSLEEDNHQGLIIHHPCERPGNPNVFGHFSAAIEGREAGVALTIMDPSELRNPETGERIGGVFQRSVEEVLEMLTPDRESTIPVFAYSVKLERLPEPPSVGEIIEEPKQPPVPLTTQAVKPSPPLEGAPMDRPFPPISM